MDELSVHVHRGRTPALSCCMHDAAAALAATLAFALQKLLPMTPIIG
jgi:hypothetical protein